LVDGTGQFAEVHLTWASDKERPPWPAFALFESFAKWAEFVQEEFALDDPSHEN
jgi:hypothetical protein